MQYNQKTEWLLVAWNVLVTNTIVSSSILVSMNSLVQCSMHLEKMQVNMANLLLLRVQRCLLAIMGILICLYFQKVIHFTSPFNSKSSAFLVQSLVFDPPSLKLKFIFFCQYNGTRKEEWKPKNNNPEAKSLTQTTKFSDSGRGLKDFHGWGTNKRKH